MKPLITLTGAVFLAAGAANAQEAAQAQPVYQYKQIELNHSHIIGIPAVILRFK